MKANTIIVLCTVLIICSVGAIEAMLIFSSNDVITLTGTNATDANELNETDIESGASPNGNSSDSSNSSSQNNNVVEPNEEPGPPVESGDDDYTEEPTVDNTA